MREKVAPEHSAGGSWSQGCSQAVQTAVPLLPPLRKTRLAAPESSFYLILRGGESKKPSLNYEAYFPSDISALDTAKAPWNQNGST